MFDKSPFDKIKQFCSDNHIDSICEKMLCAKFVDEYNEYIIQTDGNLLEELQEQTIVNTLVNKTNLTKNVDIVKSELEKHYKNKISLMEVKYKAKGIIGSVFVNILSSILFTIILIILFATAENQIRPIMQKYLITPAPMEQNSN